MNIIYQNNLRLVPRNEGKIKSYESCYDLRAWSHDVRTQNRYLKEWMKNDMLICTIPTSTITNFLTIMTCKSRKRATPRCHPDCKSKVLLESICNSCQAVKKCLKKDEEMEKYFVEEELETSHWPCDRCLEALKSIKMFWKILIDKLFNINISKCKAFKSNCDSMETGSVRSVAKIWQAEIQRQAVFINNINPDLINKSPERPQKPLKVCRIEDGDKRKHLDSKSYSIKYHDSKLCKKVSKSTSVKFKMFDVACETCFIELKDEEIEAYKRYIRVLQEKCNTQNEDIERVQKENASLKKELEKGNTSFCILCNKDNNRISTQVPQPFETNVEKCSPPKSIDSEMIITMKKGKNEGFRHVSLLQVLHKTNDPSKVTPDNERKPFQKKEDPIKILNKVHSTFGAIVRREMGIVNDRRDRPKKTEVNASYYKVSSCKSALLCSSSSSLLSSESDFVLDMVQLREYCKFHQNRFRSFRDRKKN